MHILLMSLLSKKIYQNQNYSNTIDKVLDRNFSHRKSSHLEFVFFLFLFLYFEKQKKVILLFIQCSYQYFFFDLSILCDYYSYGNKDWQNNPCTYVQVLKMRCHFLYLLMTFHWLNVLLFIKTNSHSWMKSFWQTVIHFFCRPLVLNWPVMCLQKFHNK